MSIHCDKLHPTISVADVAAAMTYYVDTLGFERGFVFGDPPATGGVNLGDVQIMMVRGVPSPAGWSIYFVVDDVDALHDLHVARGADVRSEPTDQPYDLRDYEVRDLHGHRLRFGQHLPSTQPKLPIERIDVTVRLERRLAAALADLAAHKKMTVGECLEETLLHTFEGVGPHTRAQLEHIARLKQVHGIDYDAHASYRFVES
jgi:uncharacterized glyoxalase superfamily protein PhnB